MLQPRLLQNFNGFAAHLVVADRRPVETLEATLRRLGLVVGYVPLVDGRAARPEEPLAADRDILFVDGDLDQPLAGFGEPGEGHPVPVIGLVGVEAPSRLKALVNLGATSFLRKPVHGGAVYTSLFMGINQFLLRAEMYERLQGLEERRRGRRAVIRAVILLMRQEGLDEEGAYSQLRRESMRARQNMELYCEEFLSKRAKPPDTSSRTTGITLQGGKQAI